MKSAVAGAVPSVKDAEHKRQHEEYSGKPAGEFHQHIGRLSPEDILGHASAKSSAKTLALRSLHQDDQRHQHCNQQIDGEENVNENVHFRERGISTDQEDCKMCHPEVAGRPRDLSTTEAVAS